VILKKTKTDDGLWDISNKPDANKFIGGRFLIRANSWAKRQLERGGVPIMSVVSDDEKVWIPTEVLEFTNEYSERA
jgi:hypothetical protein